MLNGIDPIIIFSFFKKVPPATPAASKGLVPVVSQYVNRLALPPIPVYLSESLTGIYIESASKNIDIDTSVESLPNGDTPIYNQKAIGAITTIKMKANNDSLGLTLLSAMADLILPKVTSAEYTITFMYGATTIISGLLHTFQIEQTSDNNLFEITVELSANGIKKQTAVDVQPTPGSASLADGKITSGSLPSGQSFSQPSGGVATVPKL